jgi:hypothetical protein
VRVAWFPGLVGRPQPRRRGDKVVDHGPGPHASVLISVRRLAGGLAAAGRC